ncbi:MAG: geranylgeranyl diphosphate synthase CrtE [Gloeobacterales cyanobacterium]
MTVQTFDLMNYLQNRKALIEENLERFVPVLYPVRLYESIRYSLLAGGKRLRPVLCLAACELTGGTTDMAMPTACALEMIHTMSLIHDDLPSMDNDDYRRGLPTNHTVYGEAMAILAGDALLAHAFHVIAETEAVPAQRVLEVVRRVGLAASASGLVGGQVVDIESEGKQISLETLQYIHEHKTGALLEVSVVSGAILGGASSDQVELLSSYAHNVGLAFQIIDDVLDITATDEQLGKTAGKDLAQAKATYPSFWGIEASKAKAQQLIAEAKATLKPFGQKAVILEHLADFITQRHY